MSVGSMGTFKEGTSSAFKKHPLLCTFMQLSVWKSPMKRSLHMDHDITDHDDDVTENKQLLLVDVIVQTVRKY